MPDAATIPPDQLQYVPGVTVQPPGPIRSVTVPAQAPPQAQPTPAPAPSPAVAQPAASPPASAAAPPSTAPDSGGGRIPPDQITDYFVNKGMTPAQAKGMTRAFMEESGGNPDAFNPAGGGQGAAGIAQWRAARQQRLIAQYGPRPTAQQQLDFAWQELNTTEKPAFDAVRQASTESAAYDAFKAKFERPGPAAGDMKAGATPSFQEFMQRSQDLQQRESGMLQQLMAEAEKEPPGSQERQQKMQQAMEHSERLARTFEDIAAHPPTEKPVDAMQNFGSLATVIAMFGGLLSKRPLTAALGAAGAAMQAMNTNNHEQFERSYKQWHDQTSLVSQALSFQNQEINQIIENERLTESERQEKLNNVFRVYGMQNQLDQAALGNWVQVYQMTNALQKAQVDMQKSLAQIGYYQARATQASGTAAQGLNQYGDPPSTTSANPNKPTPGSNIPESVWDAATTYALTKQMPTLGNSASGRAAILAATPWVFAARGMTAAGQVEQGIQYHGALAGQDTLSRRLANLDVGLSEVPHLGDQLIQVSDATPRTESMDFNRLLQSYEYHTGDPQIVKLGAAMNSYMQAYARAVNPTGQVTDDIRAHVGAVMNQAMSKGQIAAGVDQLNQELKGMQAGLVDAQESSKSMYPMPGEKQSPQSAASVGRPAWATQSASGPNGEKIYTDGTGWFHADHTPVQ